jgi:hypothetical protein
MKRCLVLAACAASIVLCSEARSQGRAGHFMISAAADVYKSDNTRPFGKYQAGIEANYFVANPIAVTLGYERWSEQGDAIALGYRAYMLNTLFLKVKPLINLPNTRVVDLNLGAGYNYPLSRHVALEFVTDYYFSTRQVAGRAGIAIVL